MYMRGRPTRHRSIDINKHAGRSRGVAQASSVGLGGSTVTRLDKAEDVFGEAAVKKPWDYVAHHPRYVRTLRVSVCVMGDISYGA